MFLEVVKKVLSSGLWHHIVSYGPWYLLLCRLVTLTKTHCIITHKRTVSRTLLYH